MGNTQGGEDLVLNVVNTTSTKNQDDTSTNVAVHNHTQLLNNRSSSSRTGGGQFTCGLREIQDSTNAPSRSVGIDTRQNTTEETVTVFSSEMVAV